MPIAPVVTPSSTLDLPLPAPVQDVLRRLGPGAWVVGGAVRDALLGASDIVDWDVATTRSPAQLARAFAGEGRVDEVLGAVSWQVGRIEITVQSLRSESGYTDRRHPDTVSFVGSIEEDVVRRDFTAGALYWDPCSKRVLDPTDRGLEDVGARVLRTVGDPAVRMEEDLLRVLRALRFAAVHGFEMTEGTARACRDRVAEALDHLPPARVFAELDRALRAAPGRAASLLDSYGVLAALAPAGLSPLATRLSRLQRLERQPTQEGCTHRAAVWVLALGLISDVASILRDLQAPRGLSREAESLQLAWAAFEAWRPGAGLDPALGRDPESGARLDLWLGLVDASEASAADSATAETGGLRAALEAVAGWGSAPPITGADVLALGVSPGPRIGAILAEVERRAAGENDRSRCMEILRGLVQESDLGPR